MTPASLLYPDIMSFESVELDDFDKVLGTTSTEVSSAALGGKILSCSDEWFAPASDLLKVSIIVVGRGDSRLTNFCLGRPCTEYEGPIWSQRCSLRRLGDTKTQSDI